MAKKKKTTRKAKKKTLDNREKLFVAAYCVTKNAYKAARTAGYAESTALKKAGKWVGKSRNNPKPFIANAIHAKFDKVIDKLDLKTEDVIREYMKVGFANIDDFIESGNEIKDLSELDRDILAAVESIQSDIRHDSGDNEGYTEKVKLKLHSKLAALSDLGKHLGIF